MTVIPEKQETEAVAESGPRNEVTILSTFRELLYTLLFNPPSLNSLLLFMLVVESVLLKVIIKNVAYTEIDYQAYMEQLSMIYDDNVTDYSKIYGQTGPLVYPAGHVLIFRVLRFFTNGMQNVEEGQVIFRWIYLISMAVDYGIFIMIGNIPPFVAALFCFSKRLHSIYVLRLFNDCFTTLFISLSIFAFICNGKFQKFFRENNISVSSGIVLNLVGVITYSFAISIKMNALLYLPAVLCFLTWCNYNSKWFLLKMGTYVGIAIQLQISLASIFLKEYSSEYWENAFDFKRNFTYYWSINWQFLSEDLFNSGNFSALLMLFHVSVLMIFVINKWIKPVLIANNNMSLFKFLIKLITLQQNILFPPLNATHIAYMFVTSNYIGIVFSRSLHYQFLSWYHWTLPILLNFAFNYHSVGDKNERSDSKAWKYNAIFLVKSCIWFTLHELCWNVYPPNKYSSGLLFALNAILLVETYRNYDSIHALEPATEDADDKPKMD